MITRLQSAEQHRLKSPDSYPVFMTTQPTDISDLSLVTDRPPEVWSTASAADGLDARLEIAKVDAGTRVAVRDSRFPNGPALVFSTTGWQSLLSGEPDLVDLR